MCSRSRGSVSASYWKAAEAHVRSLEHRKAMETFQRAATEVQKQPTPARRSRRTH
jgi:hypothetical protein